MSEARDECEAAAERGPERLADGRFGPGNPGRRAGSRNRVSQRLVMSILADFERNREQVLSQLRSEHAAAYVRLVARFLPPDAAPEDGEDEASPTEAPFAGLPPELLREALAKLSAPPATHFDWARTYDPELYLYRETQRARLAREVAAALAGAESAAEGASDGSADGAMDESGDRNNGESTVANDVEGPG